MKETIKEVIKEAVQEVEDRFSDQIKGLESRILELLGNIASGTISKDSSS